MSIFHGGGRRLSLLTSRRLRQVLTNRSLRRLLASRLDGRSLRRRRCTLGLLPPIILLYFLNSQTLTRGGRELFVDGLFRSLSLQN